MKTPPQLGMSNFSLRNNFPSQVATSLRGLSFGFPLLFVVASSEAATVITAAHQQNSCIDNYAIIQLGNNSTFQKDQGNLDITSNSSVFGGVLKGVDNSGDDLKLSTSKVTGAWNIETGVDRDSTSSFAGSQSALTPTAFNAIADKAVSMSSFWAAQAGVATNFNPLDGSGGMTLLSTGGINVFNSTTDFKLTSNTALTLKGGANDYFIFNIASDQVFQISGAAKIVLDGISPGQVLFNILGGDVKADAQIGGSDVLFAGTLLAPGRNVLVAQTHFYTFDSSGFMENVGGNGTGAPDTTAVTYDSELTLFTKYGYSGTASKYNQFTTSGAGLFGQIIAGGKVTWSESDIAFDPFCIPTTGGGIPVPDGGTTVALLGLSLTGLGILRRKLA